MRRCLTCKHRGDNVLVDKRDADYTFLSGECWRYPETKQVSHFLDYHRCGEYRFALWRTIKEWIKERKKS